MKVRDNYQKKKKYMKVRDGTSVCMPYRNGYLSIPHIYHIISVGHIQLRAFSSYFLCIQADSSQNVGFFDIVGA